MAAQRAAGGHPLSHNGCQQRAGALAADVNKIKVTIVTGEVGRDWGNGGLRKLEEAELERGRGQCDHNPRIYSWLVSRSGKEETGVRKIESIISPSILSVEDQ